MNLKFKYKFADYISDLKKPLPDDANAVIKRNISALHSDVLNQTLEKAEKRRGFGNISVYDAHKALICSMELHSGIVKTFQMMDDPEKNEIYAPLRVLYLRSYRNSLWSFRKEKRLQQEEIHEEAV